MSEALCKPKPLQPGQLVAVCAPSGPVAREPYELGLSILSERYEVKADPELATRRADYLAGDDTVRLAELQSALDDPEVRGVFCARGGYGAMRIVDGLDESSLRADPKPVCGFSDITTLLAWCFFHGVVSIHGPVVTQLARLPQEDRAHLWRLLEDPEYLPEMSGSPWPAGRPGQNDEQRVTGSLWGGNLAMLASLAGGPFFEPPEETILMLEEIAEPPYRLDRMVTQLARSGALSSVRGVCLGTLTPSGRSSSPQEGRREARKLEDVLAAQLTRRGLGVANRFAYGHGSVNKAWPVGARARLDLKRASLQLLEPATEA